MRSGTSSGMIALVTEHVMAGNLTEDLSLQDSALRELQHN